MAKEYWNLIEIYNSVRVVRQISSGSHIFYVLKNCARRIYFERSNPWNCSMTGKESYTSWQHSDSKKTKYHQTFLQFYCQLYKRSSGITRDSFPQTRFLETQWPIRKLSIGRSVPRSTEGNSNVETRSVFYGVPIDLPNSVEIHD